MTISVLSKEQIERIHRASLGILECTGVIFPHREMLTRFADCGADVDYQAERVRIAPDLVMHLLSQADHGRDLSKKAEFGPGRCNCQTSSGQVNVI